MKGITHKRQVQLTDEQRHRLESLTRNGSASAKKIQHARVLLLSDGAHPHGGYRDDQIASILGIHRNTVARVRTLFVLQGEGVALNRKVRATPPRTPKLDGRGGSDAGGDLLLPAAGGTHPLDVAVALPGDDGTTDRNLCWL